MKVYMVHRRENKIHKRNIDGGEEIKKRLGKERERSDKDHLSRSVADFTFLCFVD